MKRAGLLCGVAVAIAACAGGAQDEPLTISEISVQADLGAVGSREAVNFWQDLGSDLETAIAAEFANQLDPGGSRILVDIDELTLANAFTSDLAAEDARLSGRVMLESPQGVAEAAYDVTATSSDVVRFLPADANVTTIAPGSAAYYQAVVRAFARGTAEVLAGGA